MTVSKKDKEKAGRVLLKRKGKKKEALWPEIKSQTWQKTRLTGRKKKFQYGSLINQNLNYSCSTFCFVSEKG